MPQSAKNHSPVVCSLCGRAVKPEDVIAGELVRPALVAILKKSHPDWTAEQPICREDLNRLRSEYVKGVLAAEAGELTALEAEVVRSIREEDVLAKNVDAAYQQHLSLGQRAADRIAEVGGSWRFLGGFAAILFVWIAVNSVHLLAKPFDPYPYILLNLMLSCLAAVQAPIIMMSQNRQGAKDRMRAEQDYIVNLKAELEIRHLHEKVDHLLRHQWQRLIEIQQVQLDIMAEVARRRQP